MSNQVSGYNPFSMGPADGRGFVLASSAGASNCYYGGGKYGFLGGFIGIMPDGSEYKVSAAELRQYIMDLEQTRKIQDISNVDFIRNVQPGDVLVYNHTTGNWELQEFISGGEF